ncbi:Hypothetical predicted protein, partial [Paramuricea clavata]
MYLLLLLLAIPAALARLPACKEGEYEYEFTECDSAGGRWRVPVPRKPDQCEATGLASLKKDGLVTFSYQSPSSDVFFNVYVRNEQCMMRSGQQFYKYPARTRNFQWNNDTVHLKRGHNLIVWQAALFPNNRKLERNGEPVLIKSIRVQGVAYTSECSPCPAGSFTKSESTTSCTPCPADYYSGEGATECIKCDTNTQYS